MVRVCIRGTQGKDLYLADAGLNDEARQILENLVRPSRYTE